MSSHPLRQPEVIAALVNALVVLLIPVGFVVFLLTRPLPDNTVVARVSTSAQIALRNLLLVGAFLVPFVPLALITGWRTWVHASRVQRREGRGWQAVLEAAALGFAIALLV